MSNPEDKDVAKKTVFDTNPIAGTRDFLPEDMVVRRYIDGIWHKASKQFGFVEYDAPILEPFLIYERKGSEDLQKEMYTFKDGSGQLLAVRPEMTPTLVRLVEKIKKDRPTQLRWYSIPQCWRYETLTKGRKREFYQWNCDIVGTSSVAADADIISVAIRALEMFGFTSDEVKIRISSRKLVQSILSSLGISDADFADVCNVIDKMEKLSDTDLVKTFEDLGIGLDTDTIRDIIEAMQIDNLEEIKTRFPDAKSDAEEIETLFSLLGNYGYREWCEFDLKVIRGLTYYTGIVFEGQSRVSELKRAICGGGRYDKIFTSLGSDQDIPAAGFGMGDCVLLELLVEKYLKKERELGNKLDKTSVLRKMYKLDMDVCIIPRNEALRPQAMKLTKDLRDGDIRTDLYVDSVKALRKCFRYADRISAKYVILVAEDEWDKGEVKVKDYTMATKGTNDGKNNEDSNEITVKITELVSFLRGKLGLD